MRFEGYTIPGDVVSYFEVVSRLDREYDGRGLTEA